MRIISVLIFFVFLQSYGMEWELCDICGRKADYNSDCCKDYHEAQALRNAITRFAKCPDKTTEKLVLRNFKDSSKKYQKQGLFHKDDYFSRNRARLALHTLLEIASLPRSQDLVRKFRHMCEWTDHDYGVMSKYRKQCTFAWRKLLAQAAQCKTDTSTLEYLISCLQKKPDRRNLYEPSLDSGGVYFDAFREATKCGNIKALKILHNEGSYPYALLCYACQEGQFECFKFLLEDDSAPSLWASDTEGRTPLHIAIENKSTKFIDCILEHVDYIPAEISTKIVEQDNIALARKFLEKDKSGRLQSLLQKHGLLQDPAVPKTPAQPKKQTPTSIRDRFSISKIIEHDDIGCALKYLEKDPALSESLAPLLQKHFLQYLKDGSIENGCEIWNYLSQTSRAQETIKMICTEECLSREVLTEGSKSILEYLLGESQHAINPDVKMSLGKLIYQESPYPIRYINPEGEKREGPPAYQTPPPPYQSREKLPSYESLDAEPITPPNPLGPYTQPLYTDDGSVASSIYDSIIKTTERHDADEEKCPNPCGPYAQPLYTDTGSLAFPAFLPLKRGVPCEEKDELLYQPDPSGPYTQPASTTSDQLSHMLKMAAQHSREIPKT